MDTDDVPRMSGALPQKEELVKGLPEIDVDEAGLLAVSADHNGLSRSPSVLNDVPMRHGDDSDSGDENASISGNVPAIPVPAEPATEKAPSESAAQSLSKNQQKKLKRQLKWEDARDDRKRRRKEKRHLKQAQKREAKHEKQEVEGAEGTGDAEGAAAEVVAPTPVKERVLVPVSLIFDCAFESYMRETELVSLSSQITRSYAANRMATRQTRIYISSWQGKLRTRYETLLANQHKRWQNAFFLEGDYRDAGRQAEAAMLGEGGGVVVDVLAGEKTADTADTSMQNEPKGLESVVYLTSDSPETLTRLEPYTSYVIGGIVDKNREKGLCYGRAQEHGIRTAKLPIGEYMVMASRKVLTTNHVVEIMLQWLETGDWATAFDRVIPKRKGGRLREPGEGGNKDEDEEENEEENGGEGEKAFEA